MIYDLPLPLFVFRIFTDHEQAASTLDHLTAIAHFFNRTPYLHACNANRVSQNANRYDSRCALRASPFYLEPSHYSPAAAVRSELNYHAVASHHSDVVQPQFAGKVSENFPAAVCADPKCCTRQHFRDDSLPTHRHRPRIRNHSGRRNPCFRLRYDLAYYVTIAESPYCSSAVFY